MAQKALWVELTAAQGWAPAARKQVSFLKFRLRSSVARAIRVGDVPKMTRTVPPLRHACGAGADAAGNSGDDAEGIAFAFPR